MGFSFTRVCLGTLPRIVFFCLVLVPHLNSQEDRPASQGGGEQAGRTEGNLKIRIAVEEVRLDAVVVDKKGHQITDLTADDFEIFQDGQRQQINSCTYVADAVAPSERRADLPQPSKTAPPIPAPMLRREEVRRTIVFVVDDVSMTFENVYYARMALERFVKTQMQAGDLVAVLQTSRGAGALQLFSSDKRQLLAMIRNVHWGNYLSGSISQIMAISYCIRALRDMPGRKYMLLISAQTSLPSILISDFRQWGPASTDLDSFNMLADAALRAGVVIHTLDIRGLEFDVPPSRYSEQLIPLSKKTGGIFVKETNFFVSKSGIGEVNEELKGYYLLSYTPPAHTFTQDRRIIYHRVIVRVKRKGSEVHTRDGFFGMIQPVDGLAAYRNTLREAIFSPFRYNDLKLNLTFGYVNDAKKGYMLRSWLHLDPQGLSIVEENDGRPSISIETACVTSGIGASIQDSNNMRYEFRIKKDYLPWVKEHGIRFSLSLPVKKPGAYYARVAVKDEVSGLIGSAYQFLEIPDLKKRRLALSNIFIINRDEEAAWIQSGTTEESGGWFQPDLRRDSNKSPAFRKYLPGDSFRYMALIYNANFKSGQVPDLESQFVLFRNGSEIFKSEPEAVDLKGMNDFKRIPIAGKVLLENAAQPGDYVLQLLVKDKQAKEKHSIATQALDFEVLGK